MYYQCVFRDNKIFQFEFGYYVSAYHQASAVISYLKPTVVNSHFFWDTDPRIIHKGCVLVPWVTGIKEVRPLLDQTDKLFCFTSFVMLFFRYSGHVRLIKTNWAGSCGASNPSILDPDLPCWQCTEPYFFYRESMELARVNAGVGVKMTLEPFFRVNATVKKTQRQRNA